MSISSMSEAKLVRERPEQRPANGLERRLGMAKLVERKETTREQTPKPSGVSDNVVSQLVRWIPTETIALYVAFIALFDPLEAPPGELICKADGLGGRWAGVIAFTILTPIVVFLIHMARVRRTDEPFRWPKFEMGAAAFAFLAWALALPDTPLQSICGYEEAIGAFIVLFCTAGIGLLADALGKQPGSNTGYPERERRDHRERDGDDDPGEPEPGRRPRRRPRADDYDWEEPPPRVREDEREEPRDTRGR